MKHWFAKSLTVLLLLLGGTLVHARAALDLAAIEKDIDSYRVESAEAALAKMPSEALSSARGKYIRGKLLFYTGRYQQAHAILQEAISESRTELDWKYLSDQVEISKRLAESLKMQRPKKGYTFYYQPGNDAVLLSYAMETLEAQQQKLADVFGERISEVRIFILPSVEMLSRMCGLSTEQIEATGTVAISKYNRIMILSPALISGGYPWLDTLAHELTHLAITRVSANRAPIWLHEGIAKLMEARWRGVEENDLTPVLAFLLDQASKEKRLIPLRRFHPSVSYLPSQEDAALAYAQGLSFVTFIAKQFRAEQSFKTLLQQVANASLDAAFVASTGYTIQKLYRWWQENLLGARGTPATLVSLMERRFKTQPGTQKANIDPILDREVRRHIRVGDLLRLRGHIDAATKEYRWALEKNDAMTPDIVDRLAGTLLTQNQADEALALLTPMKTLYPSHSSCFVQSGEAHAQKGNFENAEKDFHSAIAINPFHPDIHCRLGAIYAEGGKETLAAKEKSVCLQLSAAH